MSTHKPAANFEILVIDDDKITCLLHKSLLKSKNIEQPPVLFRDGKKALEYLGQRNTNKNCFLIFLDLHMPFFSGWEFLRKLNEREPDCLIHVVLVTSSIQKKDEISSLKFEKVIGFCRKPLRTGHIEKVKKLKEISCYFTANEPVPKADKIFSPLEEI